MKNIRIFLSLVVFILMICAAVILAPRLGQKQDLPYETGLLQAPVAEPEAAGHGAASGEKYPVQSEKAAPTHG